MAIHNIRAYSKIIINKKNKKNFNLIAINNINFLKVCSKKITPLYYVIFQKEGDVVCTYFEYLLYQEYLNQIHCNTLLQCLHKQRLGQKPKVPET